MVSKTEYGMKDLLEDPKILDRFIDEIGKRVAGERDSIKSIFLHLMGSWVKNTAMKTHLLVNSESSAGKSYICNQIRLIFPPEMYEYRTKITAEAFTYWHNANNDPDWTWDGKFLYLEDVRDDVLNSPTFKIMASEGSKATVVIKQKSYDIEINGHPVILLTSANAMPSAEVVNRFGIINLDETDEQTGRIIEKQIRDSIIGGKEHYNPIFMQSLRKLMRCDVRLPEWVQKISKSFPRNNIRIRRDLPRFLDLMKASAVLHQYQREFDAVSRVVFANEQDYEIARETLKKIDDAGGSYGLTHRHRKCIETCREYFKEKEEYFSAQEIFQYKPMVSERMWRWILDKLAQKGLLRVHLREPPEDSRAKKPTTTYYPDSSVKMDIPPYSTLLIETNEINELNVIKEINETSS